MSIEYFCKGNAKREENKINSFIFYSELPFILCKGNLKKTIWREKHGFIIKTQHNG